MQQTEKRAPHLTGDAGRDDARIAIVGMACRFPGTAVSVDAYWKALVDGVNAATAVPPDRWSLRRFFHPEPDTPGRATVHRGNFLTQPLDQFDASFFRLAPREAMLMDPQQRLLLEVAWEALEDSGLAAESRGSVTGVYVGGFMLDHLLQLQSPLQRSAIDTHTAVAHTMSMLSNRLSHVFDLRGPSLSVDTACSSSLVALHLACQALLNQECDTALCGGVNVMLRPDTMITLSKAGLLSQDGLCKTFDAAADGYGRGEGAGVVVLKRLADALREGDDIRAVIAGTGVGQDGRTNAITSPSAEAQIALMRRVQRDAGIGPDQIQYVEAHGTGTQAGDQAEAHSIGTCIAQRRQSDQPLWIGSAKTSIGHLEAAAGVASIIKTVLALEHRTIPPHLNLHNPNPAIDFESLRLRIPGEPMPWPATSGPAGAAVNAFGYGGTNAHAVLLETPSRERAPFEPRTRPAVFPVSAESPRALSSRVRQLADWLKTRPDLDLNEIGYTQARYRPHYAYRIAVVAHDPRQLLDELEQRARTAESLSIREGDSSLGGPRKVAFVYTGMGIQFGGMGAELIEQEPVAQATLARCETIWRELGGAPFSELLTVRTLDPITRPEQAQVANLVLQIILTEVAAAYGLQPDCCVGHSVGEIAAAYACNALSLEEALSIVYHRSTLMKRVAGQGAMLAVALSSVEVAPYLTSAAGRVVIAAFNGPHSVTLAGDTDAIDRLGDELTRGNVFNRRLSTDVAYHSHHLDALEDEFKAALYSHVARPPASPLYSTVTAARIESRSQDAHYWWRNARAPVRWGETVAAMLNDNVNVFAEVGPHPVLARTIADCARQADKQVMSFALQRRDQESLTALLGGIAQLYAAGTPVDWRTHYACGRRIGLPPYPWDRQRLWTETDLSRADRLDTPCHPLLSEKIGEPQASWDGDMAAHLYPYLPDHCVAGEALLPAAAAIEMALLAHPNRDGVRTIDRLSLHYALAIEETPLVRVQVDSDGKGFAMYSRSRASDAPWNRYVSGSFGTAVEVIGPTRLDGAAWFDASHDEADVEDFYRRAEALGLRYGTAFRCLRRIGIGPDECIGAMELADEQAADAMDYFVHPCLLDGALQTLLALVLEQPAFASKLCLPVSIQQMRWYRKPGARALCRARIAEWHDAWAVGSLDLYSSDGEICATLSGISVRVLHAPDTVATPLANDWLYETQWEPEPALMGSPADTAEDGQTWLVFTDTGGIANAWAERARAHGASCIHLYMGSAYRRCDDGSFIVRRGCREDIQHVLTAIGPAHICGIAYFWALEPDRVIDPHEATGLTDVLDLVHISQELERTSRQDHVAVVLVTYRAQAVRANDADGGPRQQALIGLARTMRVERPAWRIRSIDIDTLDAADAAGVVFSECNGYQTDSEVAFRAGQRYVSRILRADLPRTNRVSTQFSPSLVQADGAYMVTGGASGLGLMTAAWLAEKGAKYIAILSRRGPTDEFAHQTLAKLQASGTSIWIVKCDVADMTQLQRSLEKLKTVMPTIRGVIHAAAVVEDASLSTAEDTAIARVFQAKAIGAWNLHRAFNDSPLDFFITYSSVSALLGNAGQSAYAAANGFLEGLVQWRRAHGLSGVNVLWGVIGDIGIVARNAVVQAALEGQGLRPISAAGGLAVLDRALASDWPSLGVFDIDWSRWQNSLGAQHYDKRLADVLRPAADDRRLENDDTGSLTRQLQRTPPDQHWQLVYESVTASVRTVLRIEDSARVQGSSRLNEMGLDSLMATELARTLNRRTGTAVSPLALLRGLSVAELSEYVLKHAGATA
ncbi:type I polyketide synthase [Trinickia diaoshuihuensis]|uniref:type I polyketide synthase n=1 Tax=Trinickia diaoshuihuensis TaxID=2292265 RepID=UPI0013C2C056|nr:type I polyketide synthase [Trinickia diaoshuihuensis]